MWDKFMFMPFYFLNAEIQDAVKCDVLESIRYNKYRFYNKI